MSKSLEELKNEFINQASNNIDKCPECGFHSISKLEDAWDAAIKAMSERETDAIKFIKDKIEYHKQAYSLELFPNSETLDDNSTRDSISAKMGRHMCDVFIGYLNEALKDYRGMK